MHHFKKLPDLIRLGFTPMWLQAEWPRDLRMRIDMVTPADPAQSEPERLDKPTEIREADVSQVARRQSVPKLSPS